MDRLSPSQRLEETQDGELPQDSTLAGHAAPLEASSQRFGRYRIVSMVGRGGQGVVFAAEDPVLGRQVALKLVGGGLPAEQHRVLREAQLLARVSHPNIAAIYDVGVVRDGVYLAMEFVRGVQLQQWLAAAPRTFAQILSTMAQVAHALAFAHAAGVLHCDVKPQNALVGDDGRVRVVDFGLARLRRSADVHGDDPMHAATQSDTAPTDDATHSNAGGTPGYAAPEVWQREPSEATADQFSYCVVLFEALYGQRPFGDAPGRVLAVDPEQVLRFPDTPRVPRWLRALLARGLAPDPADRHASMQALCDALARPQRERWLWSGSAAAIAVTAGAFALAPAPESVDATTSCPERASAWDLDTRARVDEQLRSFDPGAASPTRERIDAYASRLQQLRDEACVQEPETARGRLACLDDLERDLGAALEFMGNGGMRTRTALASVLDGLEPPERCLPRHDEDDAPDDEAAALLAEAHVLSQVGRADDAYAAAVLGCARLTRRDDAQWARCCVEQGIALAGTGRITEATPLLLEAFELASGLGDDPVALAAAQKLGTINADRNGELEARRWAGYLRAAAVRLARSDIALSAGVLDAHLLTANERYDDAIAVLEGLRDAPSAAAYTARQRMALEVRIGTLRGRTGDAEGAQTHFARAVELIPELTPGDGLVAELYSRQAQELSFEGRFVDALAAYRLALAQAERDVGEGSPTAARARDGLADVLMRLGRLDEALVVADANVATPSAASDPRDLVDALHTRSNIYLQLGRTVDARNDALAGLTLAEAEFGTSLATRNLRLAYANALTQLGALGAARSASTAALQESVSLFGEGHPETLGALTGLASIEAADGHPDVAIPLHERARAGFAAAYGDGHPEVGLESYNLAECLLSVDNPSQALIEAERALAIWRASLGDDHRDTRDAVALVAKARAAAARR